MRQPTARSPSIFFTVETVSLQRLYVLFFIELASCRVHLAGCTAKPSGAWVTQQARQLAWTLQEQPGRFRFLIRDRDNKFTREFDAVFDDEGIRIIKTPLRTPKSERVRRALHPTVRAQYLVDRLLITSRRHLEYVLRIYANHYSADRRHGSLDLTPPQAIDRDRTVASSHELKRRDRLGGLSHEYSYVA